MAKHTTKKATKRNPTDATLRNVRAGATRAATLSVRLAALTIRVRQLEIVVFGK
jgi:hypothetical protein